MQKNILEFLKEIAYSKGQLSDDLEKIKSLFYSKLEADRTLALSLMEAKGYTPLQAKCVFALADSEMSLDGRIAYGIIDETPIQLEGIEIGGLTPEMLEENIHPLAKLVQSATLSYCSYPQNPNIEICLLEQSRYFYVLFVADQLPFCVLGESAHIDNVYHVNYGTKHLLSINLLSEMPQEMIALPSIPSFLEIKPEIGDHMMDWVNFKGEKSLEMIIESLGDNKWGLGIGFYNEDNKYISVLDMEVNEGEMNINQDDLEKLKENYPQYLIPKTYEQGVELSSEEIKHIWIYNLLKNYL